MANWMQGLKDCFFVVGSLAGLAAFVRPAVESKHQRDVDRAASIISKLDEERLMRLPFLTYTLRRIPDSLFRPFAEVEQKLRERRQEVRFAGPLNRYFTQELTQVIAVYQELRDLVQVPEWEAREVDPSGELEWRFNKAEFHERARLSGEDEDYDAYAHHLDAAASCAERLTQQFMRFQALTELHFFEAMIPRVFVPRKMKAIAPSEERRGIFAADES